MRLPRSGWGRALLGLCVCVGLLAAGTVGGAVYLQHRLDSQIDRVPDVFAGLPDRPDRPDSPGAAGALNILLLSSDLRPYDAPGAASSAAADWRPGQQRSDALMLLHVNGDRSGVSVVSIPRDAWVDVPGHGMNKINAAFSYGGPRLAVQTVEALTDVRIDHVAWIGWDGFRELTDDLGGVTVTVPETVHDPANDVVWTAGTHRLTGDDALTYVRQRYGLPRGDFDRIERQHEFLRSMLGQILDSVALSDPRGVYGLVDTVTRSLSVDEGFSFSEMRDLAWSLRSLGRDDVAFVTTPVRGLGREDAQSVVHLDPDADGLWQALRHDTVPRWLAERRASGAAAY